MCIHSNTGDSNVYRQHYFEDEIRQTCISHHRCMDTWSSGNTFLGTHGRVQLNHNGTQAIEVVGVAQNM